MKVCIQDAILAFYEWGCEIRKKLIQVNNINFIRKVMMSLLKVIKEAPFHVDNVQFVKR